MTDYLRAVIDMIGPSDDRCTDAAAWLRLEDELGRSLPADYKAIADEYGACQINHHLYLHRPTDGWWDLGTWMRRTSHLWSQEEVVRQGVEPHLDPRVICGLPTITFGTAEGLIPLAGTDQGHLIFLAPQVHEAPDGIVVLNREGEWTGYALPFAEWLYRYLTGEEMCGWNSTVFYPGPVHREHLPTGPGQQTRVVHGPPRGM
ncbi:SMI1/KNR4 family protein [Streptomyces sp. WAC07149]|uniref:SMI1/KNR4 family protein n=1 Tax=Streptomyces sp. WAC07149 TaxID=2487425 RepID=UPI000F77C148|nr:SMI1/KNR4 family protein [Streptomyces sp. WAC07149]RST04396.1 SMI1/KNR4 family protein [Streptomyces sp. WAC07149]